MKKLSLIIPVFNSEDFLNRCLKSCINQNMSKDEFEIIIVDDGSTDNSISIIKNYQQKHSNIVVLQKSNGGVSSARNVGISVAKAEYLLFVDSDDVIKENSLNTLVDEFANRKHQIIILNSRVNSKKGLVENYKFPNEIKDATLSGVELFKKNYLRGSVCGVAFNLQFILYNNIFFSEKIINGEDSLFMTTAFLYATSVSYLDVDFYNVTVREESASRKWDYEKVKQLLQSLSVVHDFIIKNKLTSDQLSMLNVKGYRIISNAIHYYSFVGELKNYFEIKNLIKKSGMYPIKTFDCQHFKYKIKLLNKSIDLYILLSIINNIIIKIKSK